MYSVRVIDKCIHLVDESFPFYSDWNIVLFLFKYIINYWYTIRVYVQCVFDYIYIDYFTQE